MQSTSNKLYYYILHYYSTTPHSSHSRHCTLEASTNTVHCTLYTIHHYLSHPLYQASAGNNPGQLLLNYSPPSIQQQQLYFSSIFISPAPLHLSISPSHTYYKLIVD
jgi:hypothetical protein